MKQPRPGLCVPTSLAILLDKTVDEVLPLFQKYMPPPRIEAEGWNEVELIYSAHKLGVVLCPFAQEACGVWYADEFDEVYTEYDGILVGMLNDPPPDQTSGHAIAKKDGWVIDPTWGTRSCPDGAPYTRLHSRIFLAWMNKPKS